MTKNLIIAEKDSQARSLADALGMVEKTRPIRVETFEFSDIEDKMRKLRDKIDKKKTEIESMEKTGKSVSAIKKYQDHKDKLISYESSFSKLEKDFLNICSGLSTEDVTCWENDESIIVSCTGHLLDIKLDGNNKSYKNFETVYDFPAPITGGKMKKINPRWLKIKLIEKLIKGKEIADIICATDYDREGESIFGSIIEYYNIDPSTCKRMKFSSLEDEVLRDAYRNPIHFNVPLFTSGKARRWMDFVIGYNINPCIASIYRETIQPILKEKIKITDEDIKKIIYNLTFHVGRVKSVILNYIFDQTNSKMIDSSSINNKETVHSENRVLSCYLTDKSENDHVLIEENENDKILLQAIDITKPCKVKILSINEKEVIREFPTYSPISVPSFLNMTKVFEICEKLGASTSEINNVLEFLYLQKYISYPRSKSERWEIDDDAKKMAYADSVITCLEKLGYPIKEYYHGNIGNEGTSTHSHPCIHPLPSVTIEMIQTLKITNPLAFFVFNEISIHTMKCFEKNPKIKTNIVGYAFIEEEKEMFKVNIEYTTEIIEPNILNFEGYSSYSDIVKRPDFNVNDIFQLKISKKLTNKTDISKNRDNINFLNDFDVIKFLNENDIGTDATRTKLLSELIEEKYIFSESVIVTTFLGNQLNKILSDHVSFIDIDFTMRLEKMLDEIEKGTMNMDTFVEEIKKIVSETIDNMNRDKETISKIFINTPICEKHKTPMMIKSGMYGKFLQCPHYYTPEKCENTLSI